MICAKAHERSRQFIALTVNLLYIFAVATEYQSDFIYLVFLIGIGKMAEEQVYEEHHEFQGDSFQAPEPETEVAADQQEQQQEEGQSWPQKVCPGYGN